jgi:hypothetical protein
MKDVKPTNQDVCPNSDDILDVLPVHAPVNLKFETEPEPLAKFERLSDLIKLSANQLRFPCARRQTGTVIRVGCQDAKEVAIPKDIWNRIEWHSGRKRHAGSRTRAPNQLKRAIQMRRRFGMYGHSVGADVHKFLNVSFRAFDEQVNVQIQPGRLANGFYHRLAHGNIAREVAVRHVNVNHPAASRFNRSQRFPQASKIRC